MDLSKLCTDAGIVGDDQATAIRHYVRSVPLSTLDLMDLIGQTCAERHVSLVARYGSDGARVASLVVAQSGF